METQLDATIRETSRGKSGARKLRKAGQLPAVIYGKEGKNALAVTVNPDTLETIFRKSQNRNTVVEIHLDGKKIPCLVGEVQRHPLARSYVHVDFFKLDPGQEVTVEIPLEGVGKPKGAALGGTLRNIVRSVPVICAWEKIPTKITHDVSDMGINDFVNISQLTAPAGVKFSFSKDFHVLTVVGKKAEEEEKPAAEAAPAEGAAKEEGKEE